MNKLFYRPADAWVGDNIPCYSNGKFYLYYQADRRIPVPFPKGEPFGWSLAVSDDLISFSDYGEVLHKGEKGGREHCIFAGSVIYHNELFYAFYTAENRAWSGHPEMPPSEVVRIATSRDGISWEKYPELTMEAPDLFDNDYFRDPAVFRMDDGRFILIVCTRKKDGPKIRKGVLITYEGSDLLHWEYKGIFYDPEAYFLLQMPDLFRIGDWYYLLFSELDDQRRTRYRMSRSLNGPWLPPADDCFDGRCYYAARTINVDGRRFMFGWNPTRENNDDLGMWIWGGNSVIHEIFQNDDGTLSTKLPDFISNRFIPSSKKYATSLSLCSVDGYKKLVFDNEAGNFYRIDFDFVLSEGTFGFGIKFYENSDEDIGYIYHFIPGENRVEFNKTPDYPWFRCMNRGLTRPVNGLIGEKHHVTLIVDDDIALLYIDGVALNARMAEKPGNEIAFIIHAGKAEIDGISYYEEIR